MNWAWKERWTLIEPEAGVIGHRLCVVRTCVGGQQYKETSQRIHRVDEMGSDQEGRLAGG